MVEVTYSKIAIVQTVRLSFSKIKDCVNNTKLTTLIIFCFQVDDYKSENGLKNYRIEMDSSSLDAVLNEFYKIKSIYVETHKKKDS